jgi:hypothetical protein
MNDRKFTLNRNKEQVLLRFAGADDDIPVTFVWAKPLTGREQEISVLDDKKKEVLLIDNLSDLDDDTAQVIRTELEKRYLIPVITRVISTSTISGDRYWIVETDRGPRKFLMKDPNSNVLYLTEDNMIIRDTLGHCYEIVSLNSLDFHSQDEVNKII